MRAPLRATPLVPVDENQLASRWMLRVVRL